MRWKLSLLFVFAILSQVISQEDKKKAKKITYSALPVVFFSPETGLAFGGLVNTTFYLQDLSYRPSTILIGGAYTLKDQLLAYIPFEFNWDKNKYLLKGELGYYRYFYNYYGIGPDANPDFEVYTVNFPRIRLLAAYRFFENTYIGLKYNFDNYNIQELDPEGELFNDQVSGYDGSLVSLLGVVYTYDTRDYNFSASKGWLVTSSAEYNGGYLGSDFEFTRLTIDVIRYLRLYDEHILALNLYGGMTYGEAPFQELQLYGGGKKARGYFQGHFRDQAMILFQTEYRFQIWKRFGGVAFGSLGNVAGAFSAFEVDKSKWNAGLGIRYMINTDDRLNLRVDYALGENTSGLYITFGEAF